MKSIWFKYLLVAIALLTVNSVSANQLSTRPEDGAKLVQKQLLWFVTSDHHIHDQNSHHDLVNIECTCKEEQKDDESISHKAHSRQNDYDCRCIFVFPATDNYHLTQFLPGLKYETGEPLDLCLLIQVFRI